MAPATYVGRYELKERLGRGAVGDVYRAVKLDSTEVFAIKVLRGDFSDDPEILTRFLQERSALLRLDDPSLVKVRDLIVEGGSAAIVMDYLDGGDLRARLNQRGRLTYAESFAHLISVYGALETVHEYGVLHRDVKPENLLFSSDGSIHLADFGIAKLLDRPQLTQTYGVLGTPAYMAPEIGLDEDVTPAVDIYSAGIVLYETVTGQLPFRSKSPLNMMRLHAETAVPYPDGFPPPLQQFLDGVLAKEPGARPSAKEAKLELERIHRSLLNEEIFVGKVEPPKAVVGVGEVEATGSRVASPRSAAREIPVNAESELLEESDLKTRVSSRHSKEATALATIDEAPLNVETLSQSVREGPRVSRGQWNSRSLVITFAGVVLVVLVSAILLLSSKGGSGEPGRPSGVSVVNSVAGMTVSWNAPGTQGSLITGYRVSDGAKVANVPASSHSYLLSGVVPGSAYSITVSAITKSGSKSSRVLRAVYFMKPSAPKVKASFGATGLIVTWKTPADNGASISSYRISDGANVAHVGASKRRFVFAHPTPGRKYYVTVAAINKAGATVSHPQFTLTLAPVQNSMTAGATTTPTRIPTPVTKPKPAPSFGHLGGPTNVEVLASTEASSVEVHWVPLSRARGLTAYQPPISVKSYSWRAFTHQEMHAVRTALRERSTRIS